MSAHYSHIACCIDDSDASTLALDEAKRLAGGDAQLSLVHVTAQRDPYTASEEPPNPKSLYERTRRWLERQTKDVPNAVAVLLEGDPGSEVCVWADENQPDLLVAAAHRGLAQRIFLGSFASYLAHHSPVNVLLVRPDKILDRP